MNSHAPIIRRNAAPSSSNARSLTLKDIMNDVDLCVWVADAKPGDRIVYYTGPSEP